MPPSETPSHPRPAVCETHLNASSLIGVCEWHRDGRLLAVNATFLEIIGRTAAEWKPGVVRWSDLLAAEDAEVEAIAAGELETEGRARPYAKTLIQRDGTRLPVRVELASLAADRNRRIAYVVVDRAPPTAIEPSQALSGEQQTAILDTLPAHVALLDLQGNIVAVNAAWRRFAQQNGYHHEAAGVGENYLKVCEAARNTDRESASRVAAGLHSILERGAPQFEFEYPCHGPGAKRWFRLLATPYAPAHRIEGVVVTHLDTTTRVLAENRLREAIDELRTLFDASPLAVIATDAKGKITNWNRAAEAMFGWRTDEVLGKSLSTIVEGIADPPRSWPDLAMHKQAINTTARCWRRDDRVVDVSVATAALRDNQGQIRGLLKIIDDVTLRKADEEQLHALTEQLDRALRSANMGTWSWDLRSNMIQGDAHFVSLFGQSKEQFSGRAADLMMLLHPADQAPFEARVAACIASRSPLDHEFRVVWPDGAVHVLACRGEVVFNDHDRPIMLSGVGWDVTERRRAEERLRESEARLSNAQRIARLGDWEWDLRSERFALSEELSRIIGVRQEEFGGTMQAFVEAFHPDDQEIMSRVLADALDDRGPGEFDVRTRYGARSRNLRGRIEVERDASGQLLRVTGTMLDNTDIKELEDQLRHSQKLEAVGKLAGGIAHDFNNLLTGIIGFSQLLASDETDPRKQGDLKQIRELGERAAGLTRQLLAFSRKQTLKPVHVQPAELVSNLAKMLRRMIGEDIRLEMQIGADLWMVRVDPGQIEQAIINLAVNSRDAMPHGGVLTIELVNAVIDAEFVRTHSEADLGEFVRLAIKDTGCGMDKATLDRVFEPFFTTKAIGKGTGLGLSTVYGIVRQHGGYVFASSAPGQGTTFEIFLRRSLEPGAAAGARRDSSQHSLGGTERLLVVEDEGFVRTLVCRMLRDAGYHVASAADPREAEAAFVEQTSPFDLLVTDIIMPGGNGRDLYARLASKQPSLPVLFMSGYSSLEGATGEPLVLNAPFIQKPFEPRSLLAQVRAILDDVKRPASDPEEDGKGEADRVGAR